MQGPILPPESPPINRQFVPLSSLFWRLTKRHPSVETELERNGNQSTNGQKVVRAVELKSAQGELMNKHWMGVFAGCISLIVASTITASAQSPKLLDFGVGRPVPPGDILMGQNMFNAVCWACHERDLSGYKGPPLTGPTFYKIWQGRSADALFDLIRNTMPKDDPGMSDRAAHDLVAYIVAYANKPESLKDGK